MSTATFSTDKIIEIARNWKTCPDSDIAVFKQWLTVEKKCPFEIQNLKVLCSQNGWHGEVVCELVIASFDKNDKRVFHFMLNDKLELMSYNCKALEENGCRLCKMAC